MTIDLLVSMLAIEAIRQGLDVARLGIVLGWDGRWHAAKDFPLILSFCQDDVTGYTSRHSFGHISGPMCWAASAHGRGIKRVIMAEYREDRWIFNMFIA